MQKVFIKQESSASYPDLVNCPGQVLGVYNSDLIVDFGRCLILVGQNEVTDKPEANSYV